MKLPRILPRVCQTCKYHKNSPSICKLGSSTDAYYQGYGIGAKDFKLYRARKDSCQCWEKKKR